jgi:hypothetical protein
MLLPLNQGLVPLPLPLYSWALPSWVPTSPRFPPVTPVPGSSGTGAQRLNLDRGPAPGPPPVHRAVGPQFWWDW